MSLKIFFPAAQRNSGPILEVLKKIIPDKFSNEEVSLLEIGSGTGQHAASFSQEMPQLKWHPSDITQEHLDSIKAYINEDKLTSIRQPFYFDVTKDTDENNKNLDNHYDMIVCINLVHISAWNCTEGLFNVSGKYLKPGGILLTYGPYSINGEIFPESNVSFNQSLKNQNPEWGLRDIADLEKEAKKHGINLDAMFNMPSNNKTLVWAKL